MVAAMNDPGTSGGQPHDALVRVVLGDPQHTASELRSILPPKVLAHLDLDRLELQPGTFVDQNLRHRHTDLLFRTTLDDHDAYLYVLVEHQRTPDPLMALRILAYQVRIWDKHLADHHATGTRPLPLIVPSIPYFLAICSDPDLRTVIRQSARMDAFGSQTAAQMAMEGVGIALADPFTARYFRRRFGAVVQPVERAPCYEIALFAPRHPVHARVAIRFGEMLSRAIAAV